MKLFSPGSKNKKNPPRENLLYSKIKKILIFSQKKAAVIFQETELFYISGSRNSKETTYISGSNSQGSKNEKILLLKCFLYFGKWRKFLVL